MMSIQHRFERHIQTLCTCVCAAVIAVHSIDSPASDDPSAPPPFLLQSVEEAYSGEVAKADAAISKAEADAVKARKAAAAVRLKAYKDRLVEVTKSGDFDKALAVKARVDQLEKEPEVEVEKPVNSAAESNGSEKTKRPRPKDTVRFNGHTYALIRADKVTWYVAKQRCEEMGGHLVILDSVKELEFVAELCRVPKMSAWVGATDEEVEGKWKWVDNSDARFSSPHVSRAVQDFENHLIYDYSLNDLNVIGSGRFAYVCEWNR